MTCFLMACGTTSAAAPPESTVTPTENISVIGENENKTEPRAETTSNEDLPAAEEALAAETPEGYSAIGGTWVVGGIYYEGHLIDITDSDALESLYDTNVLTFNEDGSFVYLKMYNDRGGWSLKGRDAENVFILNTESVFKYDLENGALVEKEIESSDKKQYIAVLLDENTFALSEYDSLTGKAKADDDPYFFVKQGETSRYIEENKTPLAGSGTSKSDTAEKPAQSNSTSTANASSADKATPGERNALERGLQYLEYSAFSYTGLVEQLEYEGYSHSEAIYAADHCGADWKEQAAKRAMDYLEYSAFSRAGLIEQLVFEGFTQAQAEYGVNKAY